MSVRSKPTRLVLTAVAAMAAGALAVPTVSAASPLAGSGSPAAAPEVSAFDVAGGATVPFVEQEAENVAHNGGVIGPSRIYTTLPSEASGRKAVTLDAVGEYVEFTLTAPANAMSLRYSIPDNAAGTGITAPIDLRVNGSKLKDLSLTSKYSWFYGSYPFTNQPGDKPHHFYDETRTMFGSTLGTGTKVRVQVASMGASSFTIDLADFENVAAPIGRPSGSLSVVDYGANPNGTGDSTAAFQAAVDAGRTQGKVVYIPQGTYFLYDHVIVDQVTLAGAGPWYSVLTGRHPTQRQKAVGVYGKYVGEGGPSRNVTLRDFAIIGDIQERVDGDQVNAIGGAMTDSLVDNVWMQHTKCGAWMDGPMNNFRIVNSRILDQTADGVNFHIGVTNSKVENTFVRNTGDDGLAMWAENRGGVTNADNSFVRNTVVLPILANNIVIYGGRDMTIADNVVADTVSNGGGLHVGNRYDGVNGPTGVLGTFTLTRNTLIRAGNGDYNWPFPIGAIWFDARNESMVNATINVTDTDIIDSSYAAIHFVSGTTRGVNFTNVRINRTGTFAIQLNDPGAASFTNVTATGIGFTEPIYSCLGSGFAITQGGGNSGWNEKLPNTYCGPFPPPNYGGTQPTGPRIALSPGGLAFGDQQVGTSSSPRTVTISNPGDATANISSVAVSGDYSRTTTCGSTLAAGASCTASVTFTPSAAGARSGALSVSSNASGSPHSIGLSGNGVSANANLAFGRPATASSYTQVYGPGNVVDGNASSYWESANNAFPQTLTVDLGSSKTVRRVVLKLPPSSAWGTRTQTLSVSGSADGGSYATVVGSTGYVFNPATGNAVTITFAATSARYLRLTFTQNTGWPAGQCSEFEVYAN
ncbi:discoidin domain-containing protein [Phytomonospora sp. NPDC050363]|uniref:discoidin domain-containing protein n=1 Tax=Phytomonospora sp. NPDC050363 TaxID=3155642 RepID=UPI0033D76E4E